VGAAGNSVKVRNGTGAPDRAVRTTRRIRRSPQNARQDYPWGDGSPGGAYAGNRTGTLLRHGRAGSLHPSELDSMPETMVERIARFLYDRDRSEADTLRMEDGAGDLVLAGWQDYTTDAKAILAVMRDPTDRMILSIPRDWRRSSADELWQAMVDAARAGR